LRSALDRLIQAGLLFRQGVPPHASYLFKHALVQDAAYGTLLREPRRALHARIAETLEGQFADIAENQPELLARHCTEAGLIEKAATLWGKAGRRSLERSALVEAVAQLTLALDQIAALPATPALRREQIKLQVALIAPLGHVKGYAAPETRAALERANLLIEQAEAIGERPDNPLLLFAVLGGYWAANVVAGNIEACRDVATRFLALAEKQHASAPLVIGHHHMGSSLIYGGEIAGGKAHLDQAIALYDPVEHRSLVAQIGQDARVSATVLRSIALWMLGRPEAALADAGRAVKDARAITHAPSLMYALAPADLTHMFCGNYVAEDRRELAALSDEKDSLFWKTVALSIEARHLALTGDPAKALPMLTFARNAFRSTGANFLAPLDLSLLASTHAALGEFDDARHCIDEAMATMETNKEKWFEPEVNRIAGEVELKFPHPDPTKAEIHFERALAVARQQQAKSWELRAAMSLARLWRDQGKPQQAGELLAPLYGWFTEGFDTRDLKEAKALLEELAA
jgi:predicted ATPase